MSTELDLAWFDPQLGALQRPEAGGFSTGLSRAISARLGIDVVLVRVAFVVLAFCAGLGLALYGWGTMLTRGPQGTRPVDQVLPGFREWTPAMQKLAVIVSTVALIGTVGAAFPLPWGAGVLMLVVLAVMRRRSPRRDAAQPPPPAAPAVGSPLAFLGGAVDDQALVEQWRRSITDAVGTHRAAVPRPQDLPEVDLYSLDEPAPRPAGPSARAGWWAGLIVLAAMIATPAILIGAGVSSTISLAAATAVGGLGAIIFALATRRRRIPRPVLALVSVAVVTSGWLAIQTAELAAVQASNTYLVRVVADDAVVDLRDVDLSGYQAVRIDALMADVTVIVPGPVAHLTTSTWGADITDLTDSAASGESILDLTMEVNARLADVTLREQP